MADLEEFKEEEDEPEKESEIEKCEMIGLQQSGTINHVLIGSPIESHSPEPVAEKI